MSNLKDTIGTIFGAFGGIGIGLVGFATQGFALPEWLLVTAIIMAAVGPVVMGVLIGKNANLSTKTDAQLKQQENAATEQPK